MTEGSAQDCWLLPKAIEGTLPAEADPLVNLCRQWLGPFAAMGLRAGDADIHRVSGKPPDGDRVCDLKLETFKLVY
jgi:hypothetical protein